MNENQKEVIQAILERFVSDELHITYENNTDSGDMDFKLEMTDRVRRILDTLALNFGMEYEDMMQEFLQEGLNKILEQSSLLK